MSLTRGDLLNALDGGVGVSELQRWWRGLVGRSLVLRTQVSGTWYRVGALRDGRVELLYTAPGPEEKKMLLAPTEVCRRFVMAADRSQIAEPSAEGATIIASHEGRKPSEVLADIVKEHV